MGNLPVLFYCVFKESMLLMILIFMCSLCMQGRSHSKRDVLNAYG